MAVKAKGKVLSIVINNEYMRVCEVTKSGRGVVLHKMVTTPIPEECYNDGVIRDRGALEKVIKVAMGEHKMTATEAVFSVASTKIATKDVLIPAVKANKIADLIKMNATEYFPVKIEDYIVQHSVLESLTENGEQKLKVRVMAAPTNMIEPYYDIASSLGLHILAIDYVGNSTYQVLREQVSAAPTIIIQVENDVTMVNIMVNNVLQMQRTIPYGKSILVNMVMDKYRIGYDDALAKLQKEPLLHTHFGEDELSDQLRYMVSNINRLVDYYVSRSTQKAIEFAYVVGNAATIRGFVELMKNELHLPLEVITTLKNVTLDKKAYLDASTLTQYISNIGALLDPVHFIPAGRMLVDKKKHSGRGLHLMFGVSLIAGAALIAIPATRLVSVQNQLTEVQANNNKLKSIEQIVGAYYTAKDMYTDAQQFSKLTAGNNDRLEDFISELEEKIPSDVSFTNLSIANGEVTVSGTASSKTTLAALVSQMRTMKNVSSVVVGSEAEEKNLDGAVTVTFSMTCTITAGE